MRKRNYVGFLLLFQLFVILSLILYISQTREIKPFVFQDALQRVLDNQYFVNIFCSFVVIFIAYYTHIAYCKRKLLRDFRFEEALSDMYSNVEQAEELLAGLQSSKSSLSEFYNQNKPSLELVHDLFLYPNNSIIWDSISTVFFINLNFRLLGILNNINNRIPTLSKWWTRIEESCPDEIEYNVKHYCLDLKFLCEYFHELFDYFNYSDELTKLANKHLSVNILTLYNMPQKEQRKILTEAYKKARKEIRIIKGKKHKSSNLNKN